MATTNNGSGVPFEADAAYSSHPFVPTPATNEDTAMRDSDSIAESAQQKGEVGLSNASIAAEGANISQLHAEIVPASRVVNENGGAVTGAAFAGMVAAIMD